MELEVPEKRFIRIDSYITYGRETDHKRGYPDGYRADFSENRKPKNIFKAQFGTKVSFSIVVMMKHKKYNYKKKGGGLEDAFPLISNRYNLMYNDSKK